MNGMSCKKLARTELRADIVVCLIIALGVSLFAGLGARLNCCLYILVPAGLIASALIGLFCGRTHGLIAGLIVGGGTFLSAGLGILLGFGLQYLLGGTLTLIILAVLLLVCKWFYLMEIGLKTIPKN